MANTKMRWARLRHRQKVGTAPDRAAAQREAQQLIERARRHNVQADRDGNVIRPRAFDPERKKPPLH